jgi:hypothetical protein
MVSCSSCDGVPLKLKKLKRLCHQFTSMDYLSLVLTPLRIRWTVPLGQLDGQWDLNVLFTAVMGACIPPPSPGQKRKGR